MKRTAPKRTPGRPRAFDVDKVLDRAMRVFWRHGYEGTSLPMLTQAMGINRPSLYAAFGNKESLFRKAMDRYAEGPAAFGGDALAAPTAREAAERLLQGEIDLLTDSRNPKGCFFVQGALVCGKSAEAARRELFMRRARNEAAIRRRFERARAEGDLPADADPADLARYLATVGAGLAVQAAGGADRKSLQRVADLALRTWPVSP